jgi:hypothetical protein
MLPSSFSMINLNQNVEPECVQWMDRAVTGGVTGNADTGCFTVAADGGGGASSGKQLRTPRKNSFQPRYGKFLHPDYALLYPSNDYHEEPYDDEEENVNKKEPLPPNEPISRSLLTPNTFNRMDTTPRPILSASDDKLCLWEDVLQHSGGEPSDTERDCSVRISTLDKSVMTDDSASQVTRNSCSLNPPKYELCECEKRIFKGDAIRGKVIYENDQPASGIFEQPDQTFIKKVVDFNEQYQRDNMQRLLGLREKMGIAATFKSLQNLNETTKTVSLCPETSSRRSSSETSLYKSSMIAECSKCGNRFDVNNGAYFSAPIYEHVSSSSTTTTTTTSNSTDETSSSSDHDVSKLETNDADRKLTREERENILKELEEIISGEFFSKAAAAAASTTAPTVYGASIPSSMLHLDLNELKDDDSSSASSATSPNTVGRVAKLAKHFTQLGEAGIIRAGVKTKSVPNVSTSEGVRLTELDEESAKPRN